jgi:hypothetical protein
VAFLLLVPALPGQVMRGKKAVNHESSRIDEHDPVRTVRAIENRADEEKDSGTLMDANKNTNTGRQTQDVITANAP